MSTTRGFFSNFHEFNEEGFCHQQLLTMLEIKGVRA
jgi:hypothetical protein